MQTQTRQTRGQVRDKYIQYRSTEIEQERLRILAEARGMTASEWMRYMIHREYDRELGGRKK